MSLESIKLSAIPAILGVLFGIYGTWFTAKERMAKEIEARVTERVTVATKLARIEERLKPLEERARISTATP